MAQDVHEGVQASGVVVGADGSPSSRGALEWAADAALAHGLELTVVHARPDALGEVVEVEGGDSVLAGAAAVVRARQPGLTVRQVQYPESPVHSLLAASRSADLVVLGSRGLGGFRGLLVGSTTMHVAPFASCPVVVVHPAGTDADADTDADTGTPPPHPGQVVLGYDGSPSADSAAAFAFRHAAATGSGVVAVMAGPDSGPFQLSLLAIAEAFPEVPLTVRAGDGPPAGVLLQEARGCRLLVVGSRGRGGFAGLVMGSVSQKLLAHASCPVAVLHERVPD